MLDVWLGRFSFFILNIHFQDSAWKTALQSAALEYVPRAEVRTYSDVYARLAEVSDESVVELHAVIRAKSFMLHDDWCFHDQFRAEHPNLRSCLRCHHEPVSHGHR